jgi:hypothetical protein
MPLFYGLAFGCLPRYSSRQIFSCWSNRAWREHKPEVAAHRASVSNGVFNRSLVAGRIALSAVERREEGCARTVRAGRLRRVEGAQGAKETVILSCVVHDGTRTNPS